METDFTGAVTKQSVRQVLCHYIFKVAPAGEKIAFSRTHGYVAAHFGIDKENKSFIAFVNNALMEIKSGK